MCLIAESNHCSYPAVVGAGERERLLINAQLVIMTQRDQGCRLPNTVCVCVFSLLCSLSLCRQLKSEKEKQKNKNIFNALLTVFWLERHKNRFSECGDNQVWFLARFSIGVRSWSVHWECIESVRVKRERKFWELRRKLTWWKKSDMKGSTVKLT